MVALPCTAKHFISVLRAGKKFKSGKDRYFISHSYVVPPLRAGNKVILFIPNMNGLQLIKWRIKNKAYYSNLNIKDINDNKKFWDVIKPCFSEKNTSKKKIVLIDENIIITDDEKIAKTMNDYFSAGGGWGICMKTTMILLIHQK